MNHLLLPLLLSACVTSADPAVSESSLLNAMDAALERWCKDQSFVCTYQVRSKLVSNFDEGLTGKWAAGVEPEYSGLLAREKEITRCSIEHPAKPESIGSRNTVKEDFDEVGNQTVGISKIKGADFPVQAMYRNRTREFQSRCNSKIQAGRLTFGRVSPIQVAGTSIDKILTFPNGSTSRKRSVRSDGDDSVVVQMEYMSGEQQHTVSVKFLLTYEVPVISKMERETSHKGESTKSIQVFQDFVLCNGIPVPKTVIYVSSNPSVRRLNPLPCFAVAWTTKDLGLRSPTGKDFAIAIEDDGQVSGVSNLDEVIADNLLELDEAILTSAADNGGARR